MIAVLLFSLNTFAQEYRTFRGVYYEDGQNAFAVTNDQFWLKSSDGGMNWQAVILPAFGDQRRTFRDTYMTDADHGWAIGELAIVFYTEDGGETWTLQDNGESKWAECIDVYEENPDVMWIGCGEGKILGTTDGENWQTQETWVGTTDIYGLSIINEDVCWACSGLFSDNPGGQGYIFYTETGGIPWDDSWFVALQDTLYDFMDMHYTNPSTGFVIGGSDSTYEAIMYKTTDGGDNWNLEVLPEDVYLLRALSFIDDQEAWSCGMRGTMLHTEDAWDTFEYLETGIDTTLFDVDFADDMNGIAVGHDAILVTNDGGLTWVNRFEYINYPPDVFSLYEPFFGEMVDYENVEFIWNSTVDIDSDNPVTYGWYLAEDATFENIIASAEGLVDTSYVMTDVDLNPWMQYFWKVKAVDNEGNQTWCRQNHMFMTMELSVAGENISEIPQHAALEPNYPNPFNPITHITYSLPGKSNVNLNIYDTSGRLVKNLVSEDVEPGYHTIQWTGKDYTGKNVGSGVYIYQLEVNGKLMDSKKMTLLR